MVFKQNPIFEKAQKNAINFANYYTNNPILTINPLGVSLDVPFRVILSQKLTALQIGIRGASELFYCVQVRLDLSGRAPQDLSAICYLVRECVRDDGIDELYEFRFYGEVEPCCSSVLSLTEGGESYLEMRYISNNGNTIQQARVNLNNKKNSHLMFSAMPSLQSPPNLPKSAQAKSTEQTAERVR